MHLAKLFCTPAPKCILRLLRGDKQNVIMQSKNIIMADIKRRIIVEHSKDLNF